MLILNPSGDVQPGGYFPGGSAIGDVDMAGYRVYDSTDALNLGKAGSDSHTLGTDDVYVGGKLEVDGVVYFDDDIQIASNQPIGSTSANGVFFYPILTGQTPDTGVIATGAAGNSVLITELADITTDFAFPQQTNPTLCIQSADATAPTGRIWFAHDQTNGVIQTGKGGLSLVPFSGSVIVPDGTAAAPGLKVGNGGMYNYGANVLGVSSNGAYAARWDGTLFYNGGGGVFSGNVQGFNLTAAAASAIQFLGRSKFASSADGVTLLTNNAGTQGLKIDTTTDGSALLAAEDGSAIRVATVMGAVTLAAAPGGTTFAATSNVMEITGTAPGSTVGTITGGIGGMMLTLIFKDALTTITDTAVGAVGANQVCLSAAFTGALGTTLTLVSNGTYWQEVCRSVNG